MTIKEIVEAASGIYRGRMSEGGLDIVLFDSPRTRSTLCLPVDKVTVEAVRNHIQASDLKFLNASFQTSIEELREAR